MSDGAVRLGRLVRIGHCLRGSACALAIAAIAVSCRAEPTEPIYGEQLGVIHFFGDSSDVLEVPPSAVAGIDFAIVVHTFGNGCTSAARTTVQYYSNLAIVTPYDSQPSFMPPNWACPDILVRPRHEVTLRFPAAGTAFVRVEGRRNPAGDPAAVTTNVAITP